MLLTTSVGRAADRSHNANMREAGLIVRRVEMDALAQTFSRAGDLMTRVVAGETLIVPVRSRVGDLDSIYTLNEIGSRIWQLLDGRTTVAQIAQVIAQEYEVTDAEAAEDALALLDGLIAAGLVRPVGEGEG